MVSNFSVVFLTNLIVAWVVVERLEQENYEDDNEKEEEDASRVQKYSKENKSKVNLSVLNDVTQIKPPALPKTNTKRRPS